MKSGFDVIVRHFPKNEDINIYLIADLHVGALEFLEKEWHDFRENVLAEGAYLIIAGDMMNNTTRSSVSNIFDETMRPREQKRWLANELEPFRDRILCATDGNHERRSERDVDDNPLYDVMAK